MKEKKKNKIKFRKERGITLIALVITVVILIILATVTLNVVLGEGGLIQRAQQAKEWTEQATSEEQQGLNSLMSEMANIMAEDSAVPIPPEEQFPKIEEVKGGEAFSEKTVIKDKVGNKITIPAGFKVASDSGNTVQQGIVIEDVNASTDTAVQGSQYVWIPVGVFIKDNETPSEEIILGRYDFDTTDGTAELKQAAYTSDSPDNYTNEVTVENEYIELNTYRNGEESSRTNASAYELNKWIDSVKQNGGYYIGRYEASFASGDNIENYKAASKISTNNSKSTMSYTTGTLWNDISQLDASKISINTYSDSISVKSDLMNSYAWDTAIAYIQEAGIINYANKRGTDINTELTNTGTKQDEACKINDMASNLFEWTTEYCTSNYVSPPITRAGGGNGAPCTVRGGIYDNNNYFTCGRGSYTNTDNVGGFRITLYMQ